MCKCPALTFCSFSHISIWKFIKYHHFLFKNILYFVLDLKSQKFSKSVVYDKSYYQKLGFVPFSQKLHLSVRDARIILDLNLQMRFQGLFHLNFPIPYDVSSQINPIASHFELKYFLKWVCTVQWGLKCQCGTSPRPLVEITYRLFLKLWKLWHTSVEVKHEIKTYFKNNFKFMCGFILDYVIGKA